jgi:hypothetical protein
MYDLDLMVLFNVELPYLNELHPKKFIGLNLQEVILFYADGSMIVFDSSSMLKTVRSGTIFNIKGEDYLDMLLIKSREHFLFSIEK